MFDSGFWFQKMFSELWAKMYEHFLQHSNNLQGRYCAELVKGESEVINRIKLHERAVYPSRWQIRKIIKFP